jgi:hypothetical protein
MNYVKRFIEDNGLVFGQPFKISVARQSWFCFNEDYSLDLTGSDEYMRSCVNFDHILLRLLTGEIKIVKSLGG